MPEVITQSVGGKAVTATATFTRPANTTAYTSGDIVSNSASATTLMKFARMARSCAGSGALVKARLVTDNTSDTSSYRLYLYTKSEAGLTIPADNAAATTLYADKDKLVGYIDFAALTKASGTNTAAHALWTGGIGSTTEPSGELFYVTDAADTALYGVLVVLGALTPTSGQNFWVELTAQQN
ncbi:MAG TPA: hypothetical protein VN085_12205 [Vicinamibacterales bacterium]|nr:hypothetical protein [Vicinamibacterales bacterium]